MLKQLTRPTWILALATLFLISGNGHFQPVAANAAVFFGITSPPIVFQQFEVEEPADLENSYFLPIPREYKIALDRIRQAAIDEKWTDAASGVLEFQSRPEQEDYLEELAPNQETTSQSISSALMKMIGAMPPRVMEEYQLLVGGEPKALLDEAIETQDIKVLSEVAQKYLFTPEGELASLILARNAMDQGEWEGALLQLQRLDFKPIGSRQHLSESELMRAICLQEVSDHARARSIIEGLRNEKTLERLIPSLKFTQNTPPEEILGQIRNANEQNSFAPFSWRVFQGSETRSTASRGSAPLQEVRWKTRMANSRQQEDEILASLRRFRDHDQPVFPTIHPVLVNNQVIFKSPNGLLANDISTGKIIWRFPWDSSDIDLAPTESDIIMNLFPGLGRDFERAIWANSRSGQLSSDGKRVFYVYDEDDTGEDLNEILATGGFRGTRGLLSSQGNSLYCFDLEREGAILWQISELPTNKDFFGAPPVRFLGPPLPIDGDLYAIAGVVDEIRLLCLDAETGEVRWFQQLARQTRVSPLELLQAFLQAATPSHKGGILICPTNSGSIVALDLKNRNLLWGFQYKEPNRNSSVRRQSESRGNDFTAMADRWTDGTAIISQGKVLVTPTDSDFLYCLDIFTGDKLWELPRQNQVALLTVFEDIALTVGPDSVTAININDGRKIWGSDGSKLPKGSIASGYGFRLAETYYLPTTSNRIVPIDIKTGEQSEPIEAIGNIGNLVCYQDHVISVSPESVTAFMQIDALRQSVKIRLAKDANDPEGLRLKAKLQRHDGDLAGSIASLERSLATSSDESIRTQFVSTALFALNKNYAEFKAVVPQVEKLAETTDEKLALSRMTAAGLQAEGNYLQAFRKYLLYLDLNDQNLQIEDPFSLPMISTDILLNTKVRPDFWARGKINELLPNFTPQERAKAESIVQQRFDALVQDEQLLKFRLKRFIHRFPKFKAATPAKFQLAQTQLAEGQLLQAEALVRQLLEQNDNPDQLGPLVYQVATQLEDQNLPLEAARWYARIADEFANVRINGRRTGRQVIALKQWNDVTLALVREKDFWPTTQPSISVGELKHSVMNHVDHPIRLDELNRVEPTYYSVKLDSESNQFLVRDRYGQSIFKIPFTTSSGRRLYNPQISAVHAKQVGHLLIVSLGNEIQAFNMFPLLGSQQISRQLWSVDVHNGIPGSTRRAREVETDTKQTNPFSEMPVIARDVTSSKPIGLFAANSEFVCYQIGSRLECRDIWSGELFWSREETPVGCEIALTDDHVILIPPTDEKEETVDALLYSVDYGSQIGQVELPDPDRIWTIRDGVILTWTQDKLESYRLETGEQIWSQEYPQDQSARAKRFQYEPWVAVLTRDGKLEVTNYATGEIIHSHVLETQSNVQQKRDLDQIKLIESDDRYLIALYPAFQPNQEQVKYRSVPFNNNEKTLRGEIYAFAKQSGEMLWDAPATIENSYLLEGFQSPDLPVIVLVARLARLNARTPQSGSVLETVLIDARDGHLLYRNEFIPLSVTFDLSGDPEEKSIKLQMAVRDVTLRWDRDVLPAPAPTTNTKLDFSFPTPSTYKSE